jgi:hypothetical protein
MDIVLTLDDERLGKIAEDGAIERYPRYTLNGREYAWRNATMKRVGVGYFVVIEPNQDSSDLRISAAEPVEVKPRRSKGEE